MCEAGCVDPKFVWDVLTALGSVLTGVATVAVALVAWRQIGELKSQQKGWETLKACERYELDPVLNQSLRRLARARRNGDLKAGPGNYEYEFTTIMNYFEGLATGINLGFYDERIIRQHLEPAMRFHWGEVTNPEFQPAPVAGDDPLRKKKTPGEDFARIGKLLDRWARGSPTYSFMRDSASQGADQ